MVSVTCPVDGKRREAQASLARALGARLRGLHAKCYRRIKGRPAAERFVTVYRPSPAGHLSNLRERAPKENQTLPTGAIIHWPEIYYETVPGKHRPYTKTLVPVTCGVGGPTCM